MSQINKNETMHLTVAEIKQRLLELNDAEEVLLSQYKGSAESVPLIIALRQEEVGRLLSEKEKFNRVFKTANGSQYFQLQTGECVRAKHIQDKTEFGFGEGSHYKFQPMMTEMFFVSQSETDRIIHKLQEYPGCLMPGEVIKTEEYSAENHPFELNMYNIKSKIAFQLEEGHLKLLGTVKQDEYVDTKGNFIGDYHFGHKITEILK